jgi:hypothetical protein
VTIISNVLHDIVDEFLMKEKIKFHIKIFNNISEFQVDILTDFMSKAGEKFDYRFIFCDLRPLRLRLISRSNILVIRSLDDYEYIENYYDIHRHQNEPIKYFVLIPHLTYNQLESSSIFSHFTYIKAQTSTFFMHSYFITNELDTVTLSTVEWFSPYGCNTPYLSKLNTFNKKSMRWTKKLTNYEKFLNYHGCELVMMVQTMGPDGSINHVCGYAIPTEGFKNFIIRGLAPVIFEISSKVYNFTPEYQPVFLDFDWFTTYRSYLKVVKFKGIKNAEDQTN